MIHNAISHSVDTRERVEERGFGSVEVAGYKFRGRRAFPPAIDDYCAVWTDRTFPLSPGVRDSCSRVSLGL